MRVWVTRDEGPAGPLCAALRAAGLEPVLEPVIERRVLTDAAEEIGRLGPDDWLVLTSVYAIEHVASQSAMVPRVAVVGEVTRGAAEARGFRVELVAPGESREALWGVLRRAIKSGIVCYPRSSLAPAPLAWPGVTAISPILYETVPRAFDRGVIHRVDAVAVASPSAVEVIGRVELPFASIGPATSEALRKLGIEPCVEAPRRTFESLAEAISQQMANGEWRMAN